MDVDTLITALAEAIAALPVDEQVEALNAARLALHEVSPLREHPVDLVLWVPAHEVEANDYNPNTVAVPGSAGSDRTVAAVIGRPARSARQPRTGRCRR